MLPKTPEEWFAILIHNTAKGFRVLNEEAIRALKTGNLRLYYKKLKGISYTINQSQCPGFNNCKGYQLNNQIPLQDEEAKKKLDTVTFLVATARDELQKRANTEFIDRRKTNERKLNLTANRKR
jgi:hypothetical protein